MAGLKGSRLALRQLLLFVPLLQSVACYNFPYEAIQLTQADIGNNSDIAFGTFGSSAPYSNQTGCKTYPGDADWPSAARWTSFNSSLGGALIKGLPPAAVCYHGPYYDTAQCNYTTQNWSNSTFFVNNPTSQMEQWTTGNTCPLPYSPPFLSPFPFPTPGPTPNYTCNVDGQAAYVVNASTVKHVQLAVNFARNNNLRVVIKNTGHDFMGRSSGSGALLIWTHNLRDSQYLPSAHIGDYRGRAIRMGAGMESWRVINENYKHNVTIISPGGNTVGAYGGYMQGGGHSILSSYYGLMVDQVLSFEVVTADGKFLHADPDENEDLFWAIRGGGGSTFGVVTSVVVKAYPNLPISTSSIAFATSAFNGGSISNETFWNGIHTFFKHLTRIVDAKGSANNFITSLSIPGFNTSVPPGFNFTIPGGNTSVPGVNTSVPGLYPPVPGSNTSFPGFPFNSTPTYSFTCTITMPGMNANETYNFMAPLIADLRKDGIAITNPPPRFYPSLYATVNRTLGVGEGVGNGRFGSRLFPRANFEDETDPIFNRTIAVIKDFVVNGGYSFHSVDVSPTLDIAGSPGADSAVNPAFRNAIVHATGFDTGSYGPDMSPARQIASHARLNSYIQKWRDVTPGAGAYGNEADTEEPDFQQSFYGENYGRLSGIKRRRDPWGVFYAVTGVGSEAWEVRGTGGLPIQRGRLCKVEDGDEDEDRKRR